MAYVTGFFAADGTLTKGKRGNCYIEFCSCDKEILEKIQKEIKTNLKIGESFPKNRKWSTKYRLQIGSKKMFEDLKKLGFTARKSKIVRVPKTLPSKYFSDFLRGCFDGDGHISICTYIRKGRKRQSTIVISGFISGSKKMLLDIRKKLSALCPSINGGSLYEFGGTYRLSFSILNTKYLYRFLYHAIENNLFLSRKKEQFEKFFKMH